MQEKENLIFFMNGLRDTLEENLADDFSSSSYFDLNHDLEYTKDALKTYCNTKEKECQERKDKLIIDMKFLLQIINEISMFELDNNACELLKDGLEQCTNSMVSYFELYNTLMESEKEEQIGV